MKVFLISHIADLDGLTPVILSKLVFENFDYKLLEVSEVDDFLENSLNNNLFDDYDKVFMTDLCISADLANKIDKLPFKEKFLVLDHHIANIELNKYSFINVIDEENGRKESGTSLYYQYLLDNYPIKILARESVSHMVTLVRLNDTWEWKKYNVDAARDLNTILGYYGVDKFINNYVDYLLTHEKFEFTENEKLLIDVDKKRMNDYIEEKKSQVIFKEFHGYKTGIVFAELYRSELGNSLSEYYSEVDFIIIINLNRSISYRCCKDEVDVNSFAQLYGGKGHKKAAGSPLPLGLKEMIIEYIFGRDKDEY